jgi:hypothetical protein
VIVHDDEMPIIEAAPQGYRRFSSEGRGLDIKV